MGLLDKMIFGKNGGNRGGYDPQAVFSFGMRQQLEEILAEFGKFSVVSAIDCTKAPKSKREVYGKWNALIKEMEGFCEVWVQKENLRINFERANEILTAYYKDGKILDYLERINRYIDGLMDDEDPVVAFKVCHSNYIYFLSRFVNDLKEKIETRHSEPSLLSAEDVKTRQWVAEHEFGNLKSILAFGKIIRTAEELKSKARQQAGLTPEDKRIYASLIGAKDEYDHGAARYGSFIAEDIESIRAAAERLKQQISNMESEIKQADALYEAIKGVLSPEWFGGFLAKLEEFDRIDAAGSGMTGADIKALLIDMTSEVREKIMDVYPRM